ncbi:MAG: hypothetical protein AB7S44_03835 [Spirochaetales bacterium]
MRNEIAQKKLLIAERELLIKKEKSVLDEKVLQYYGSVLTNLLTNDFDAEKQGDEIVLLEDNKLEIYKQLKEAENKYLNLLLILKQTQNNIDKKYATSAIFLYNKMLDGKQSAEQRCEIMKSVMRTVSQYEMRLRAKFNFREHLENMRQAEANFNYCKSLAVDNGIDVAKMDDLLYIGKSEVLTENKILHLAIDKAKTFEEEQPEFATIGKYTKEIEKTKVELGADAQAGPSR